MDIIFKRSENSKTSEPHVLILKLCDKLDLSRGEKILLYQILLFTMHGETYKSQIQTMDSKYQLQHEMINLNYLMGDIPYQILKITLSIF